MTDSDTKEHIILTIDDEDIIRASFRFYLEDYGYKVLEAENGRVGLEVFERENPDLILVDLRMPEVDATPVKSSADFFAPLRSNMSCSRLLSVVSEPRSAAELAPGGTTSPRFRLRSRASLGVSPPISPPP